MSNGGGDEALRHHRVPPQRERRETRSGPTRPDGARQPDCPRDDEEHRETGRVAAEMLITERRPGPGESAVDQAKNDAALPVGGDASPSRSRRDLVTGLPMVPAQRLSGPEPSRGREDRCGEEYCPAPVSARPYRVKWQFEGNMWVLRFGRQPRVVRLSCRCRPVEYEELAIGGRHWIRRIERSGDGLVVHVSPETANRWVDELWDQIMSGDAW
ncbi:hypothetical protein [Nonomuraea longicatena]|uniref:Uncharacterized protein n=1 Tax=Nonomuraea longicatena TaxID=83682 RepID=A0ABP4BQ40_9ACTN